MKNHVYGGYHTSQALYDAFRTCNTPYYCSRNRIEIYVRENKLFILVENTNLPEEIKTRYIRKRIKRFVRDSDLQKIIDGLNIPVSISDLKKALEKVYSKRK